MIQLEQADSTNAWCKRSMAGLAHLSAVWTGCQTAGRGRLGRSWHNAPGQALYYSIVFRRPMADAACLPLAASLAAADAVEECFGAACRIKWPNDLLLGGKKAAGILCEGAGGGIVCGIGVNLAQPAAFFAAAGLPHATSLQAFLGRGLPADAAGALAEALSRQFAQSPAMQAFYRQGFAPLLPRYRAACVNLGRPVWFEGGEGVAETVDARGRLVVRTAAGEARVFTGEVSVQGVYGRL